MWGADGERGGETRTCQSALLLPQLDQSRDGTEHFSESHRRYLRNFTETAGVEKGGTDGGDVSMVAVAVATPLRQDSE